MKISLLSVLVGMMFLVQPGRAETAVHLVDRLGAKPAKPTPTPKPSKKEAEKESAKPVETGPAPALKLMKAQVGSPLFIQGEAGFNVLANVAVTATATPTSPGAPVQLAFSPSLGQPGVAVLNAVKQILTEARGRWPAGYRVDITAAPLIAPEDVGAAALAVAVLLDSMTEGWEADPTCSVVGGLQASGKIQAATSALMRLTTASRSNASRILMPEKNVTEGADCLVNEGVGGAGRVQMLAFKNFEEILSMASVKMDEGVVKGLEVFSKTQKTLGEAGDKAEEMLKSDSDLREDLRTVLENCPNHMTARLLLGRAVGRYTHFSLRSSVDTLDRISPTIRQGLNFSTQTLVTKLEPDKLKTELETLEKAEARVDPRMKFYVDILRGYGEAAHKLLTAPSSDPNANRAVLVTLANFSGKAFEARSTIAEYLTKEPL
jgi:hypothetical protein